MDFAVKVDPGNEALYREALVFDLYLREKAKSRPSFAKDLKPYEKKIRALFDGGLDKRCHVDVFSFSVWEEEPKMLQKPVLITFDYKARDALDHNAKYRFLSD